MDNRLYGKTILVGKEAQQSRLLIAININGKYRQRYADHEEGGKS